MNEVREDPYRGHAAPPQPNRNNSVVGNHSRLQEEKATQGQKPAHHPMKKPATV